MLLARPYTSAFSFFSTDQDPRLSWTLFWWVPGAKLKPQMELTPARSAGHWLHLKHGDYPNSILVKFSFPIRNTSDRLWCATLRAKTITIISHVTWFGKLVRVWLSELWGKGKHWVWAWERCRESRSSPLVMCKVRDGARIESGSMLGKRLQPSDNICAFTRSEGEKWYSQ